MDIYKALKLEKKYEKIYYSIMIFLIIILPISVFLAGLIQPFYIISLIILEALIGLSILRRINSMSLKYSCHNNRLKIKSGLFKKEGLLFCDKVVLVHTEKMEEDMEIIIITSVNFKNKKLRLITKQFLKRYPAIREEFERIKENNPDNIYYYQVVRYGGLNKYVLLDTIYKNCVKSVYTEEGIQNIKISRGQTLV
ncbi:hypothetical protein [uncultured Clostridium sp.]|uniref:hypothetical protein n=1 Tax=uncultured Clostridium sp. TaxID=59620 RepID=UPI0025DBB036|nr:hypothetical protein [uncultured Clostridium sp.]